MLASLGSLEAVERHCARSAAVVHQELAEGSSGLAAIASTAFFFGIFGNVFGIVGSFTGGTGEKSAVMAALAESLSESMWPTAFSLLVGLMALSFYRYLSYRLSVCDREMAGSTVALLSHLGRYRQDLASSDAPTQAPAAARDDRNEYRWMLASVAMVFLAFCLEIGHFYSDSIAWDWMIRAASLHVLFTFGLSCIPAQFLWMKVLHRRRGTLALLASVFCFCWCFAEILFEFRAF